jgi:zinc transport system substrate-binding protein
MKMSRKNRKRLPVILAVMIVMCGCGSRSQDTTEPGRKQDEKIKVVTTLFPYYDFTRQIGGDKVELTMVVPAGMDSHSFEPTPADMRTIQEADVLICNGGSMEIWVSQVLDALDTSDMTVITMMDYVDVVEEEIVEGMEDETHDHANIHEAEEHDHGTGEGSGHDDHEAENEYDEHIWTSPVNAMKFTEVIADILKQEDPGNCDFYEDNKQSYLQQLEEIHQGFLKVAEDRKRNTIIVGDKFPFRYLADEYGFDYRAAFSGCSTDTEPSAKTIAYLIDKVKEEQIPAVYYLELSSHRVSEIIGEETGAEPMLLHSCHNVTRREFDAGITYIDLMRQNVENLRKGLDE